MLRSRSAWALARPGAVVTKLPLSQTELSFRSPGGGPPGRRRKQHKGPSPLNPSEPRGGVWCPTPFIIPVSGAPPPPALVQEMGCGLRLGEEKKPGPSPSPRNCPATLGPEQPSHTGLRLVAAPSFLHPPPASAPGSGPLLRGPALLTQPCPSLGCPGQERGPEQAGPNLGACLTGGLWPGQTLPSVQPQPQSAVPVFDPVRAMPECLGKGVGITLVGTERNGSAGSAAWGAGTSSSQPLSPAWLCFFPEDRKAQSLLVWSLTEKTQGLKEAS